jgi:hypothetical protein
VGGGEEDDGDHGRAAEDVHPQVDLHPQANPTSSWLCAIRNGTTATSPTIPDTRAAESHQGYCLNTAHAATAKPITAT